MMLNFWVPAAALLAATAAQAASLRVTFDNPIFNGVPAPSYDAVSLTFPNLSGGSRTLGVHAGRFQGTASHMVGFDPDILVDGPDNLYMYCYDLYQSVGSAWVVDYTIDFDGETTRTLDFLGAVNTVLNAGKAPRDWDPYAWLHPSSGAQAAAIQIGIWESRFETDAAWSLGTGSFRASGLETATSGYVSSFFAALPTTDSIDGKYVMTLVSGSAQDMITGDPPAQVPVPGTLALALLAMPALAMRRRR